MEISTSGAPARSQLLGRLGAVPAVGRKQRQVLGHDQHGRRARETGEVPDVRERRDDEGVDLVFVESGA